MALAFEKTNTTAGHRRPAFRHTMQGAVHRFAVVAAFVFIAAAVAVL